MFKDLTRWHWRFFLQNYTPDERDRKAQHWQEFRAAVESAVRWAGGEHAPVRVPEETLPRQSRVRVASLDWHEQDGISYSLEAHALLDAFYIQTACALQGQVGAEAVARLKQVDWPGERTPVLLGEAICLTGELSRQVTEGEAKELARVMLERWFSSPPLQLKVVELPCGFLSIPMGISEEAWVLLVRDDDQARRQAAELVNRLMPPLLLSWVKGQAIMQELERRLLPDARAREAQLDELLKPVDEQPARLRKLERLSEAIAQQQGKFAKQVSDYEEMLETLKTNADNAERLLEDPLLIPQRTRLDELWVAPLRLKARQAATDLRYFSLTQSKAEWMHDSIETLAQVRGGRWSRNTTILLGVFAAFELLQVFPEIPLFWWRIGLSILLPALIVLALLFLTE